MALLPWRSGQPTSGSRTRASTCLNPRQWAPWLRAAFRHAVAARQDRDGTDALFSSPNHRRNDRTVRRSKPNLGANPSGWLSTGNRPVALIWNARAATAGWWASIQGGALTTTQTMKPWTVQRARGSMALEIRLACRRSGQGCILPAAPRNPQKGVDHVFRVCLFPLADRRTDSHGDEPRRRQARHERKTDRGVPYRS